MVSYIFWKYIFIKKLRTVLQIVNFVKIEYKSVNKKQLKTYTIEFCYFELTEKVATRFVYQTA